MPNDIFKSEAPKYWKANLPVVPVEGKAPMLPGWTGLLGGTPSEAKQAELRDKFRTANIGMLTGFEIGQNEILVAIDVDDDRLLNLALFLLGLNRAERRTTLSGKRGKKGATIFVRAPKKFKSTVIKGAGGLGNIDILAAGKMTVMPPSMHPDTNKPYQDFGLPVLKVDLKSLPKVGSHHIQLLKVTIGSEHAVALISGEATHDAGVSLIAVLVAAGATDEEIPTIIEGLLPENYEGNSLKELPEWIRSARDKNFDEPKDGETNSLTQALVTLALESEMTLFNDGDSSAYATLPHLGKGIAVQVSSSSFSLWLRHFAHIKLERAVSSGPLRDGAATLEAVALFDQPTFPVHVRIAGNSEGIVVDLGGKDGLKVRIRGDGWRLEPVSDFMFVRGSGFQPLPQPQDGGSLSTLQTFFGLDDQNYRLLLAFLINALKPDGPYFILLVEGEQGSGKSFFCEAIKRILDPNAATRLRLPEKPQDLMIQAKEYRLLNFDNASGMGADMSDALCSLATGGGIAVRKLYTDGELYVMTHSRPFVINGIGGYASRPDLMERGIPIRLEPMPEGSRKTEAELMAEFELALPGILGCLYTALAHALNVFDTTEPPRHLRMADAARWIKAASGAIEEDQNALINAIASAQREFVVDRINEDPLVMKLRALARLKTFEGYIGELFAELMDEIGFSLARSLPKSPAHLSNQLKRMRPAMQQAGVLVEFLEKDRKGRRVRVSVDAGESHEPPF